MNRAALGHLCRHGVCEVEAWQVVPESIASTEDDRGNREVQVVDQAGAEELAGGAGASVSTSSIAPLRKWKVVPPCIGIEGRGAVWPVPRHWRPTCVPS